jgi:hypothetical protein
VFLICRAFFFRPLAKKVLYWVLNKKHLIKKHLLKSSLLSVFFSLDKASLPSVFFWH